MPYSSDEGKDWLTQCIWGSLASAPIRLEEDRGQARQLPPRVLDIGAGSGTYADLIQRTGGERPRHRRPHLTAMEIHEPYVARFKLLEKYDEVIVGDARTNPLPQAEVVILGDVLEHMTLPEAVRLWEKARRAATAAVILSLPIVEWPQGAVDGNPHEAHLHTWTDELVREHLAGIVGAHLEEHVGVYWAQPLRTLG